jgi:flagellar motility protein MotE (MotC chaperone)
MTKQRHSDIRLRPSRLCRLLLAVFSLKLAVLGLLIFEPIMPDHLSSLPGIGLLFQGAESSGRATAIAATGAGAGAVPALAVSLPDAGMEGKSPGAASSSPASPGAVPDVTAPFEANSSTNARTLPAISRDDAVPGAVNGTSKLNTLDSMTRRQEDMVRKEQELRVLEGELSDKLEKMRILENRLGMMIKDAEETKDAKFRHLVDVLANMKSKQAAAVLETLDSKVAVRVLSGMRGRQAGEILTFVRPEIAAQLTESLARMQLPLD